MTMPFERTRALCWAHEALSEICGDVMLAKKYRAKAAELLCTYPSPAIVSQWIGGDVTCIPADAAAAIEETGALMRSIRGSMSCSGQLRRSLHFALRHFPEPGTAGRWAQSATALTIRTWLRPEDQCATDEWGFPRRRADVGLEGAPVTRAFLEAHPEMWPQIGSSVPAGWDHDIAHALLALKELADMTGARIRIDQIKSKLAGLRIYISVDDETAGASEMDKQEVSAHPQSSLFHDSVRDRAAVIIDAAADRCRTLCERCGLPGTLRNDGGWSRIDCGAHAGLTRDGDHQP